MRVSSLFVALTCAALASTGWAGTLQDVRQAAEQADPTWLAAQRTWEANQQLLVQARGNLMPGITASYSHTRYFNTPENPTGDQQKYDRQTAGVNLVQPLFRLDAWYGYKQAKTVVSADEASFAQARQDFLLRVATQYVNVLRNWDALQFARANEKAIGRQLEQTQERYKVGLVPITDVQQAQSIYDNAKVTLISAKSQFAIARDQLDALSGKSWDSLDGLKADLPMEGVSPADPAKWITLAQQQNPQLLAAQMNAKAQSYNASVKSAAMLPQVEVVAGYNHTHTSEQNVAAAGIDTDNHGYNVGVQVSMPLFVGGVLNSQRKQAALLSEAADATYKAAYRDTGQAARTQYRLVQTDAESIKAGAQAIKSAQTALEATQEGYKVGTSTIIDVLNAESLLYQARSNYANARYDYIIDSLTLKATAGVLSEKDLAEVNGWLDANNQISLDLAQAQPATTTKP